MASPTKYQREYSFTDFQSTDPSSPLPGAQVDNELENIEQSLGEAIDAIGDVRRADGKLKNGIVTIDSLDATVAAGVGSGALASAEAAAASADAAASSAAAAAASATAADGSADDASGYATAAQGYRNEASTSKDLADTARGGAQDARDAARDWATAAEDAEVDDGVNDPGFSAYHYMKKAEAFAGGFIPDGSVTEAKLDEDVVAKLLPVPASGDAGKVLAVNPDEDGQRFMQLPLRSVFEWFTAAQIADVKGRTLAVDLTDAIQSALASGESLFFPAGAYRYEDTLKLLYSGQKVVGAGRGSYGAHLRWHGTGSVNCVEMQSGRRDAANTSLATNGLYFGGFFMTQGAGSSCANAIWWEDGVFHSTIEQLYWKTTTSGSYPGPPPSESVIKFAGATDSYGVHNNMRDVVVQGLAGGSITDPVPIGIWLESGIEIRCDNVFSYNANECWRLGGPSSGNPRGLYNVVLNSCMAETGDRNNVASTGSGMVFYDVGGIDIVNTKISAGVDATSGFGNQRPIRFKGKVSEPSYGVRFRGGLAWSWNGQCDAIVEVEALAEIQDSVFNGIEFLGPTTTGNIFNVASNAAAEFRIDEQTCNFRRVLPSRGAFRSKGWRAASKTFPAASTALFDVTPMSRPRTLPSLAAVTAVSDPVWVQAYQKTTGVKETGEVAVHNPLATASGTGTNGFFRQRQFADHELLGLRSYSAINPANTASGECSFQTLTFPGAAVGDILVAEFGSDRAGMMICAHATAASTARVTFFNKTGSAIDLASDTLRIAKVNPAMLDGYATDTWDPASIADGSYATRTITVAGAALGYFACGSVDIGTTGVAFYFVCTGNNAVTLVILNETGGAIDLGSLNIVAGVFAQPLTK